MKVKFRKISVILLICLVTAPNLSYSQEKEINLESVDISRELKLKFGSFYQPVKYHLAPKASQYKLPLKPEEIENFSNVKIYLEQSKALELFLKNGFVTIDWGKEDDVVNAYKKIKQKGIPIFITCDSLLHLYHIQFDETLKRIEEKEFYNDLINISRAYQKEFQSRYKNSAGLFKEVNRRGLAFFTVALKLLDPETKIPEGVEDIVNWELKKIEEHNGFPFQKEAEKFSIFKYMEDYSQYLPRGHYTQSENLNRYFKAMMWYGRMTMLIKGNIPYGPDKPALVSPEEARIQTILASLIASLAGELKVDEVTVLEKWNRIYAVSAYYTGFADDLTIYEYLKGLKAVFGSKFKPSQLALEDNFSKLKRELEGMRKPTIYSGTGKSKAGYEKGIEESLEKSQGFRFMGQRYVPDSYILGRLILQPLSGKQCFTTVCTRYGCFRGFPRGLDVMAVLGFNRALEILDSLGDSVSYSLPGKSYNEAFLELKRQFDAVSVMEWNQNLYWSWLYVLKSLSMEDNLSNYPSFMQTKAYKDKQLNCALGGWTTLRHDTILYVKQSYTPTLKSILLAPRLPGYVEPLPEFYARLIAITRMTLKGLEEFNVLDEDSKNRLISLDEILNRLLQISINELENKNLTDEDYNFINNFADHINSVVMGLNDKSRKTTLIADVHTDQNSGQVLEEGCGYLRLMLVAYKLPEGHIYVGAGPTYSYYEFKHPMEDRLTDEKWEKLLQSDRKPSLPEWTKSFASF